VKLHFGCRIGGCRIGGCRTQQIHARRCKLHVSRLTIHDSWLL